MKIKDGIPGKTSKAYLVLHTL